MQKFSPVICGVLGAAAVALAALQYHWTAQLRHMEAERLRFALRSAAAAFVREVSVSGAGSTDSLGDAAARWFGDSPFALSVEVREIPGGRVRFRSRALLRSGDPAMVMPFSAGIANTSVEPADVLVRLPFRGPELVLRVWLADGSSLESLADSHRNRNLALSLAAVLLLFGAGLMAARAAGFAAEAGRRQLEMVAAVSHELKTPVAIIRSAAQNLTSGIATSAEQVRQYGDLIDSGAQRLTKTLGRVLIIAGAPQRCARGELVDVASVLREVDHAELRCEERLWVHGDADAIRAAVEDLVSNARKHGRASEVVRLRAERGFGRRVLVAVEDDGPGIPDAELGTIFEPFRRGSRAVRERVEGSGLGLYLVACVARAHGGQVRVRSSPTGGSIFVLDLPEARLV